MYRLVFALALSTSLGALTGCAPAKDSKGEAQPAPTVDSQISGYWKLFTPNAKTSSGVKAPEILHLEINRNNLKEVTFCDLEGSDGTGVYVLNEKHLTIPYLIVRNAEKLDLDQKKLELEITKMNSDSLEFDNQIIYTRVSPPANLVNALELCKK